jgi:hypothetical protein
MEERGRQSARDTAQKNRWRRSKGDEGGKKRKGKERERERKPKSRK